MPDPLSVLIVEDSTSHAALMTRQLASAGFDVRHEVVGNAAAMRGALRRQSWDLVLASFSLPGFNASEALALLRDSSPDVPLIVISGVIGDERAIELMRLGAKDYVLTDNMARLTAAVQREVEDARERARYRESELTLQRIEKDRELLATAVNSATTPVAICDARGKIEWINAAFTRCTGFAASEALGQNLRKLLDSGLNEASLRASQVQRLRAGQPWSGEMLNQRKDGTRYPDHVTLTPVSDASGRVTHFIAIMHDLSEQRRMEERLLQSQRLEAIGQLTGGIAHDFNNLLTVILGNSELLSERLASDPTLGPLARMITTAAERGADLTRALLAFAGKQKLAPQPVDVNRLVLDMQPLLRRSLGEHIDIRIIPRPALGLALIDAAQLESALLNLCLNARDAMPDGGQLTIETACVYLGAEYASKDLELVPGDYVMIAVSDTGCGIAPEHKPRLFEPFFTTKPHGKGTGLGLPQVYGFIKQSGGQVNIYSELDHGTTVKLYLPQAGDPLQPSATAEAASPSTGGHETILLAEDNEQVRSFAVAQLTGLGYQVIAAADGPAALEIVRQREDIDLLFTDMVMPGGMLGHELAAAARQLHPGLKVLYTSGHTDTMVTERRSLDVDFRLLGKPYRRADLARAVRTALDEAS